ncbi:MAG: DUF2218 domain-containing protein [Hyphomicrobiales bacterium]|nr:DUF2218 domain-containing protein [Hyphomicrobiales bacterium]
MIKMEAYVDTPNASRYLIQLCKHFRHKATAEWTETEGRVEFPFGLCIMRVEGEQLLIDCEVRTAEELGRMRYVLDDHIRRFAWRESLTFNWSEDQTES